MKYRIFVGSAGFGYGEGWWWQKLLKIKVPESVAIVTKTLTFKPIKGSWFQVLKSIRVIREKNKLIGIANKIGLVNLGVEKWKKEIYPSLKCPKNVFVSLFVSSKDKGELVEILKILKDCQIAGIELNISCPNYPIPIDFSFEKVKEFCQLVKKETDLPLILKIGLVNKGIFESLWKLKDVLEAISLNSVPWETVFSKPSPFKKGGGVSGKVVQKIQWELGFWLQDISGIPVIFPSVWEQKDAVYLLLKKKVSAISVCSAFLLKPWILKTLNKI